MIEVACYLKDVFLSKFKHVNFISITLALNYNFTFCLISLGSCVILWDNAYEPGPI